MDTSLEKTPLLIERFSRHLETRGRRPLTIRNNLRGARRLIEYLKCEEKITDLRDVDKAILSRYQSYLVRQPKRLRLTSQLSLLIALRNFFSFLEAEDLIFSNPTTQIELPRTPKQLPLDTLSEREMKQLFKACDLDRPIGLRDRAILEVLYSTGIRSHELAGLKLFDLDQAEGILRIREGKGGRDRVVPIGEVAIHYTHLYLAHARPKLVRPEGDGYLFINKKGRPMSAANPGEVARVRAAKAGIKRRAHAHMIRRSCATHMLRRGAPIRYIQELLGHKSLDTTQRYTKVVINDLKRVHARTHPREIK